MKPLLLKIQAFGPYVEEQTIDFEDLGKDGLFLIKGKTGSGKTTIFDAMTFALYGGSSGDEEKAKGGVGRNSLAEWRCRQAGNDVDTVVSLTFIERGKTYNFTRKLVYKRVNFAEELTAKLILPDGKEKELFENPKKEELNKKAIEIIGLTKEQFRQVVLLPQGQFEKFIVAESGDKEVILKKLFKADQWEKYAKELYDRADARVDTLKANKKRINDSLSEVDIRTDLVGDDKIEVVADIDDLERYIKELKISQKALDEQFKEFNIDEKKKQLQADRDLSGKFGELRDLENKRKELEQQKPEYDNKNKTKKEAMETEPFRILISEYETAAEELENRKNKKKTLVEQLPSYEEKAKDAEEKYESYKNSSPVQENTTKIGELKTKESSYEKHGVLKLKADELYVIFKKSEEKYKKAEKVDEENKAEAAQELETYNAEERKAIDYRNRYLSGIYGDIASKLEEGTPCPVCGNIHHPDPAKKADNSIGEDEMKNQNEISEQARNAWEEADNKRKAGEAKLKETEILYKNDEKAYLDAKRNYDVNKESLIEGINDLEDLKKEIEKLDKANDAFVNKCKELEKKYRLAQSNFEGQNTKIEEAEENIKSAAEKLKNKENALNALMKEKGYSNIEDIKTRMLTPEKLNDLTEEIASYEQLCSSNKESIEEKQKYLKDKEEPDATKFEERESIITSTKETHDEKTTSFREVIDILDKKRDELSPLDKEYRSNIQQAEDDLSFAKKLRGDTGMGLQRYVLAIMFDQVIGEANRMLSKVHSGRYQLFRTDEKGAGNKKGLELKVYDKRSPEDKGGRSVRMLSGGEKFLVSLALSIGMSTIAQKAGMSIDSLFIDEGFGTLDSTSITDAMEVLECVRKNSGMIGIISHVAVLEENIPTQIEVIKTDKGNYIKTI